MKTLWIVSGGIEAVPGIALAKRMGYRVVVSDGSPEAPGFRFADKCVLASTYDVEATLKAARSHVAGGGAIDGVLCVAADVPLTVARIAEEFDLPGIPVSSAELGVDKLAMKQRFSESGVPVPWFQSVANARELAACVKDRGHALVVKPVDSRGARGVVRIRPGLDFGWVFETARRESPSNRVMVEAFLPGPQISTESVVLGGHCHTLGFSDRNYEHLDTYAPFIIEDGGTQPSLHDAVTKAAVHTLIEQAARAMGVDTGIVKGDIVVCDGKPFVIELAPRLSGGYFCTHQIPLHTGVDILGIAIRLALAESVDPAELVPRSETPIAQRFVFAAPGRVVEVSGVDEVSARPEVEFCHVGIRPGDFVRPIRSHPARPGMVIASGESREAAIENAAAAVRDIRIRVE